MKHYKLYINGQFVDSFSKKTFESPIAPIFNDTPKFSANKISSDIKKLETKKMIKQYFLRKFILQYNY